MCLLLECDVGSNTPEITSHGDKPGRGEIPFRPISSSKLPRLLEFIGLFHLLQFSAVGTKAFICYANVCKNASKMYRLYMIF